MITAELKMGHFLTDQFPTAWRGAPWRYHNNAMYTSYCAKPMGCGGLIQPGDNYYRRALDPLTIHIACAEKLYALYHQGENHADV